MDTVPLTNATVELVSTCYTQLEAKASSWLAEDCAMPFWKCYYHLVWATKHRFPALVGATEATAYDAISRKARELKCHILAINGTADHIHVAVNIPPSIAIATFVQQTKGLATHEINRLDINRDDTFKWQRGYGVLTFGAKTLPMVVNYIDQQKQHHQGGTTLDYLERTDDESQ